MLELQLLNAILKKRDNDAFLRNDITSKRNWTTHPEAFNFIMKHLKEFGELPTIADVIENVDNFESAEVVESVDTLARKLVERNLKNAEKQFLKDTAQKFGELNAYDILESLAKKVEELQSFTTNRANSGIDWASTGRERIAEYQNRKKHDFSKRVPFLFDELTERLGEMQGGFLLAIMGFTGKGKTWLGLKQGQVAHKANLKVLIESGEMDKPQVAFRLDSIEGGFSNKGLYTGALDYASEDAYEKWAAQFNQSAGKAPVIIKTPEDWPHGLTLYQIETDIRTLKPDVVIIDQFSLIHHASNDRDGKTATSRRLKEIAGKYGVVIVLLYQANGDYERKKGKGDTGENEVKELVAPTLSDYSETIAIIQDADAILTLDTTTWYDEKTKKQCGKGLAFVAKSRGGGEGMELDLNWIPDFGVIETRKATDKF